MLQFVLGILFQIKSTALIEDAADATAKGMEETAQFVDLPLPLFSTVMHPSHAQDVLHCRGHLHLLLLPFVLAGQAQLRATGSVGQLLVESVMSFDTAIDILLQPLMFTMLKDALAKVESEMDSAVGKKVRLSLGGVAA
jgi:hypothetical protein